MLFLAPLLFVAADITSSYIETLPFSVDVVTPKYQFLSWPAPTNICNMKLLDLIAKVLHMDNFDLDIPIDISSIIPVNYEGPKPKPVVVNFQHTYDRVNDELDAGEPSRNRLAPMEQIRALFFTGVLFTYLPTITQSVLYSKNISSPLMLNPKLAADQLVNQAFKSKDFTNLKNIQMEDIIDNVSKSNTTWLKNQFTRSQSHLELGPCDCECFDSTRVKYCDCNDESVAARCDCCSSVLNKVPDQIVGALASRTIGGALAGLLTDYLSRGLRHASPMKSFGDVLCEANQFGIISDFLPDWTPCVLDTLSIYLVACTAEQVQPLGCSIIPKGHQLPLDNCTSPIKPPGSPYELTYLNYEDVAVSNSLVEPDTVTDNDAKLLLQKDRQTMNALWHAQVVHAESTIQRFCEMSPIDKDFISELLPGWPIKHEIWVTQENSQFPAKHKIQSAPYTAVSKKNTTNSFNVDEFDSCEFLITTRGSTTDSDWHINVQFSQVPIPGFKNSKIKGHAGYLPTAIEISRSIQDYLVNNHFTPGVEEYCNPNKSKLYFSGHSLGGGMTNLLSLLIGNHFKTSYPDMSIVAQAVASLRVFNDYGVELQKKLINIRNFRFEYDVVPTIPCPNTGLPRCDPSVYGNILPGKGIDEPYAESANLIYIHAKKDMTDTNPEYLKYYTDSLFINLPNFNSKLGVPDEECTMFINIPPPLQFSAAHICSYSCFFSSRGCTNNITEQSRCFGMTTATGHSCFVTQTEGLKDPKGTRCYSYIGDALPPWSLSGKNDTIPSSIDCTYNKTLAETAREKCLLVPGLSGPQIWKILWPIIEPLVQKYCSLLGFLCDAGSW